MSARIRWEQGQSVTPQHFQQQERFLLQQVDNRVRDILPYNYGFSLLQIDLKKLEVGYFALTDCSGVFPDGTCFDTQSAESLPIDIELEEGLNNATVYLAIPLLNKSVAEFTKHDEPRNLQRYLNAKIKVDDNTLDVKDEEDICIGQLRLKLFVDSDDGPNIPDGYTKLAIAQVKEVVQRRIRLKDTSIAVLTNHSQSKILMRSLGELHSMLVMRADSMAERITQADGLSGVTNAHEFMLLQVLNKYDHILAHYQTLSSSHPIFIYQMLLQYAGELATFWHSKRRADDMIDYFHDDLSKTFPPLINKIKRLFNVNDDRLVERIDIDPPKSGYRLVRVMNASLFDSADFILAVKANVSSEVIRKDFPATVKIAAGEDIIKLVKSSISAIDILPVASVPRELVQLSGYTYFELDKSNSLWKNLSKSQGMVMHISGDYPELDMQLWAINRV